MESNSILSKADTYKLLFLFKSVGIDLNYDELLLRVASSTQDNQDYSVPESVLSTIVSYYNIKHKMFNDQLNYYQVLKSKSQLFKDINKDDQSDYHYLKVASSLLTHWIIQLSCTSNYDWMSHDIDMLSLGSLISSYQSDPTSMIKIKSILNIVKSRLNSI